MNILRTAKLLTLTAGKSIGVFHVLSRSEWRKNQLLILGYHGVSLDDEYLWNPDLYISPEVFRSRMQILKDYGCNVLPLTDALQRLENGTLPTCSVVLTFDDGSSDFYRRALPILREFGWPATVYLTSYYCDYNRPVFDVMCSYLLWKRRDGVLDVTGVIDSATTFDLSSSSQRESASLAIRNFCRREHFSAKQKDDLLKRVAERLSVDYQAILAKRILHLLSPEELAAVANCGVNVELHTHRHYAPKAEDLFTLELEENRKFICKFTKLPHHFAYPYGAYADCYKPWLDAFDVKSAATCDPGLVTNQSDRYRLPRLVDTSSLRSTEFESWISGFSQFLPRKPTMNSEPTPPHYY